jgi:hypothetical protein
MKNIIFAITLISVTALASTPKKELSEKMGSILDSISTETAWKDFVSKNKNLFPEINDKTPAVSVVVVKDEVEAKDESFSIGTAYRQVLVKTTPERMKTLLSRPDLFQTLYGLDKESAPASNLQPGEKLPDTFEAHIFKRLPSVLPDQEYTLKYSAKTDGSVWFQRVTQVEDKSDFALRETLLAVETTPQGTVFREIGKMYPLGWFIRAMGAELRKITKSELEKVSTGLICMAESKEPLSKELATKCVSKK